MLNTLETSGQEMMTANQKSAYKAAVSHSARVKRLKILLPVAAVVISMIFIAVSVIRAYLPENISIEGAKIEDGKIVMARPAIAGRNSNGTNYSMVAERALQDIRNPNMITLKNIKAAMPVNTETIAHVLAASADFDRSVDSMKLTEPFTVTMDNGLTAEFKGGDLDVKSGKLITDQPVAIQKGRASVVAQSMKITDKGSVVEFEGQVRMHIDPAAIHNSGS